MMYFRTDGTLKRKFKIKELKKKKDLLKANYLLKPMIIKNTEIMFS